MSQINQEEVSNTVALGNGLLSQPRSSFQIPFFCKHDIVVVNGLQSKPEYNGHVGTLGNKIPETGRWKVHLKCDDELICVKPENLIWIVDGKTLNKGAVVCHHEYIFTYMIQYLDKYNEFSQIDMTGIAECIATQHGIRFEDRTAQLERIQVEYDYHGFRVLEVIQKVLEDCCSDGKLLILFRRTLLSNAAIMYFLTTSIAATSDPDSANPYPYDFLLYFRDDFFQSRSGPRLTEDRYRRGIVGLIAPENVCSICADKIDGHLDNTVIDCGHMFHIKCFQQWMQASSTFPVPCPNCRSPYTPPTHILDRWSVTVNNAQEARDLIDAASHGQ
jgi:hypothetical protein